MKLITVITLFVALTEASIFDFIQNQFGAQNQGSGPQNFENHQLNSGCDKYLCPDTSVCVDTPKHCPCPYPSSQLRCFLPNGNYMCISKPAGIEGYEDSRSNWKVDAKDDNVRDCGWVSRRYKGV